MNIIDPQTGLAVTTAEGGAVKVAHDPERVHRRRTQLNKQLLELQEGWQKDNAPDPTKATRPDKDLIDEHWTDRWQDIARTAADAKEPVIVEFNAMAHYITEQRTQEARAEEYTRKLSEVVDLTPWSFKLVGRCTIGHVWMNDRAALCIDTEGMVLVHLRPKSQGLQAWSERAWLDLRTWEKAWELPDMHLGELFQLLKLFRYEKMCAMPEELMANARTAEPATA